MIIQRPELEVSKTFSNDWTYKLFKIGTISIPNTRNIYLTEKGKLGYFSKNLNKIVPYSSYNGIIKISMKEIVFEVFEKELAFNSHTMTFYHTSKHVPDKNLEIELGKEFVTENNGHVKIVAFEKVGVYAQEDQWIGLFTRAESKIDGAIRFNLLGQVLSHGKDPNYNLKQEKPKSYLITTIIWQPNDSPYPISLSYNSIQTDKIQLHIDDFKKRNIEYKIITNEVEL